MFTQQIPIVLASASPRRQDFLKSLRLHFTIQPASIDETPLPGERPEEFVMRLAHEKARSVAKAHPKSCAIGADTIVCMGNTLFGKPGTPEEALLMLQRLRGKTHKVMTGIALIHQVESVTKTFLETTSVTFAHFSDELLKAYIANGDPMDKAGSYGIQSGGAFLVETLQGSYSNVVGLPLTRLVQELVAMGVLTPVAES